MRALAEKAKRGGRGGPLDADCIAASREGVPALIAIIDYVAAERDEWQRCFAKASEYAGQLESRLVAARREGAEAMREQAALAIKDAAPLFQSSWNGTHVSVNDAYESGQIDFCSAAVKLVRALPLPGNEDGKDMT